MAYAARVQKVTSWQSIRGAQARRLASSPAAAVRSSAMSSETESLVLHLVRVLYEATGVR
jgi:hypothetical protein